MNIKVLLASEDKEYTSRLGKLMKVANTPTGDKLEISIFDDIEKLKKENFESNRFNITLTDDKLLSLTSHLSPLNIVFTEDDSLDEEKFEENNIWLYKYQRASSIINKLVFHQSNLRKSKGLGTASVCLISSISDSFKKLPSSLALSLASSEVKPLYVNFEIFNTTDLVFKDTYSSNKGLYDVFCSIAAKENVTSSINTLVQIDRGVKYIKRFRDWREVSDISEEELETFIEAARAANEVDLVILDFGTNYGKAFVRALDLADEIIVFCDEDEQSKFKLDIFMSDNPHNEKIKIASEKDLNELARNFKPSTL